MAPALHTSYRVPAFLGGCLLAVLPNFEQEIRSGIREDSGIERVVLVLMVVMQDVFERQYACVEVDSLRDICRRQLEVMHSHEALGPGGPFVMNIGHGGSV